MKNDYGNNVSWLALSLYRSAWVDAVPQADDRDDGRGGALLTIDDRTDEFAVVELPDEAPALIGVVPLEVLDYTVQRRKA